MEASQPPGRPSHDEETRMNAGKIDTVPEGYHTVTPFVIARGAARFLDFMAEAFDATELARVQSADGLIGHAETRIGDSVVMTFDSKEGWPATPSFLRIYVEDCEATCERAIAAGATSVTRPTEMPWGDRVGRVRDPLGNLWWIMARLEDVSPEEMERRYGEKKYIDAMAYVEGAEFFPR
jgi:PhnB protein